MKYQDSSQRESTRYLYPEYQCFCGKMMTSKSLLYTHCGIKHGLIFQFENDSIYFIHVEESKITLILRQMSCRKRSQSTDVEYSEKKQQKSRQGENKKQKIQDCKKQFEDSTNSVHSLILTQKNQQNTSIFTALKQYLKIVKKYDEVSYKQTKILASFIMDCVITNRKRMKQIFLKQNPNPPENELKQIEYFPGIFNILVTEHFPQVLFGSDVKKSELLKSTKFANRRNQINFLGHLHTWLKLKNYCKSKISIKPQAKQLIAEFEALPK